MLKQSEKLKLLSLTFKKIMLINIVIKEKHILLYQQQSINNKLQKRKKNAVVKCGITFKSKLKENKHTLKENKHTFNT